MNFENYTERARRVITLAEEESRAFNHVYIGTEHLLLGLLRERDGLAAMALNNLGIDLDKVREKVGFIIGEGEAKNSVVQPQLTPRSKKVLLLAEDIAKKGNDHYVGVEHILLGLVQEGEGIAAGVLESLGVNYERAEQKVKELMEQEPESTTLRGYLQLCRFPFLQDEQCNLPAGHEGEHEHLSPDRSRAFAEATERAKENARRLERPEIDIDRIMDLVQEYGKRNMEIGFFNKGTPEYTASFREMVYAWADLLCVLHGKEPPKRD